MRAVKSPYPRASSQDAALARLPGTEYNETVARQAVTILYVLTLIAVVVGVDVLFFRHQLWERLTVNIGIVLVFAAFYVRFLKHP
jgi:predicted cobalt transporter CbtA